MQKEHLTTAQLDAYRRRTLAPADLLAVDRHLSACDECREELAQPGAMAWRVLESSLRSKHLTHEQLANYADGKLESEEARCHLEQCAACRVEAADLRRLAAELDSCDRLTKA